MTPVVTNVPGAHGRWERTATPADVVAVARAADALGYDHLTCAEHAAVPAAAATSRGARYWDPVATLGYLAAHTSTIRLAASVFVLGHHHPLALAKRCATLDLLSGGRLVVGVGVGSLAEEFNALGVPFADRGPRADDALRALRAALSAGDGASSYEGAHVAWRDMVVDPAAVQARVPLWVGGRTRRSLRRAVELADGWMPFGLDAAALASMLASVERPDGFDLVLAPARAVDPTGDPDAAADAVGELVMVGATIVSVRVFATSASHYVEQLHALAEVA